MGAELEAGRMATVPMPGPTPGEKYILFTDLAAALNADRSNLRKNLVRTGLPSFKVRHSSAGGQLALAITESTAKEFLRILKSWSKFGLGGEQVMDKSEIANLIKEAK